MRVVKGREMEYTREAIIEAIDHEVGQKELTCPHCKKKFKIDEAYISQWQYNEIEYCIKELWIQRGVLENYERQLRNMIKYIEERNRV